MKRRRPLIFALLALPLAAMAAKPDLMLAEKYHDDLAVSEYWVSEKLDGVRARWNGKQLISRGGNTFAAPTWFTQGFPSYPLDGELWTQRGDYENISSITSRHKPHEGWRHITLMVFDLPAHRGPFSQRVKQMKMLNAPQLKPIPQFNVTDAAILITELDRYIKAGAEGLMLHHQDALYRSGRSSDLLKLKRFDDAEATVIGYTSGKGKFTGMLGSLNVKLANGTVFKIGSGLKNTDRQNPPPIGALVTFKHQGLTKYGVPRFPVFLRVRDEL